MKISSKVYDILKPVCQIILPAILTIVTAVMAIRGTDEQIIAAVASMGSAVIAALGSCLGISTHNYNKEHIADEIEEERWGEEDEDC